MIDILKKRKLLRKIITRYLSDKSLNFIFNIFKIKKKKKKRKKMEYCLKIF